MVHVWVNKDIRKLILETDDGSVRNLLESVIEEKQYVPYLKRWSIVKKTVKIYDNTRAKADSKGNWKFELGLGWSAYVINVLKKYISQEDYDKVLMDAIYSENVRTFPFQELRDYQNEDVLHILKYKIGLFNVYTSYGKFI